MARRKNEVVFQAELTNQDNWDDFLTKPGLHVVDVYAEWCGPCKAIGDCLRKIRNESPDADFLHLAVANSDTVPYLEAYRGTCEPCFLMFGASTLVAVVRGVNPPMLITVIKEQMQKEKRVMAGEEEREEFIDPRAAAARRQKTKNKKSDAGYNRFGTQDYVEKQTTLVILKPDLVESKREEEVIEKLRGWNLEVLERETRTLGEDEISVLYAEHVGKPYYADLVSYMSSGPSTLLVLSQGKGIGEDIAEYLHNVVLGPRVVEDAKDLAPGTLRALFGSEEHKNGVHTSSDRDAALRDLNFFFPGFSAPRVPRPKKERTVALIRPEAVTKHADALLATFKSSGFQILMKKNWQFTEDEARKFYKNHEGRPYYEELIAAMTSGLCMAVLLEKEDGVAELRRRVGPGKTAIEALERNPFTIRALFPVEAAANCVHAATTVKEAEREVEYFFPLQKSVLCVRVKENVEEKEELMGRLNAAGFKVKAITEMLLSPEDAKEFYGEESLAGTVIMVVLLESPDVMQALQEFVETNNMQQAAYLFPDEEKVQSYVERVVEKIQAATEGGVAESSPWTDNFQKKPDTVALESQRAPEAFDQAFSNAPPARQIEESEQDSVEDANSLIRAFANASRAPPGASIAQAPGQEEQTAYSEEFDSEEKPEESVNAAPQDREEQPDDAPQFEGAIRPDEAPDEGEQFPADAVNPAALNEGEPQLAAEDDVDVDGAPQLSREEQPDEAANLAPLSGREQQPDEAADNAALSGREGNAEEDSNANQEGEQELGLSSTAEQSPGLATTDLQEANIAPSEQQAVPISSAAAAEPAPELSQVEQPPQSLESQTAEQQLSRPE